MKTGTIPFPREFGPGAVGIDCRAVKEALANALGGAHGMDLKTNAFAAKTAGANLSKWKLSVGLLHTPEYTLEAHEKLRPFFTVQGAVLMVKKAMQISALKQRTAYVTGYRWMIAHHVDFNYFEVRPIPESLPPPWEVPLEEDVDTDCSGSIELDAVWTKCPDPSKMNFDGGGNTGTLLAACTKITQAQAQMADLIVYRAGTWDNYGHHVVAILERIKGDFLVGSNGHQGNPGEYTHTEMLGIQSGLGYPLATFLRWLPAL